MCETKYCKICKLPNWHTTYYGNLKLDKDDKCIFCNNYESFKDEYSIDYLEQKKKFDKIVEESRDKGEYDCIVLFTGGKDSSYTLYLMAKVYGLKTLALTWDNGFFNNINEKNINDLVKNLGVDHKFIKTDWNILKDIYKNRLSNYGRFCNCVPLSILFASPIIYETKAPIVVFSSSYGQTIGAAENAARIDNITCESSYSMKDILSNMGAVQIKNIAKSMYDTTLIDILVGNLKSETLDEMKNLLGYLYKLTSVEDTLYINPSCYFDWDIDDIIEKITECGWQSLEDKGKYGHTSCIAERMKGYLSYKQKAINFDVVENSALLRTGIVDVDNFNKELKCTGFSDEKPEVFDYFLEKLEMTEDEMSEIINMRPALRDTLPEINIENLKCLPVHIPMEQLREELTKAFKTNIII